MTSADIELINKKGKHIDEVEERLARLEEALILTQEKLNVSS